MYGHQLKEEEMKTNMFGTSDNEAVTKTTYMVRTADYELIREVFPEPGFITNFPGELMHLVAEVLRQNEVTTLDQRRDYLSSVFTLMETLRARLEVEK